MKLIEQSYTTIGADWIEQARKIEMAGRVSHYSYDKMTDGSYESFIRNLIKCGHESPLEFGHLQVLFTCSRAIADEIARHRHTALCMQSTRYCNYSKDKFDNELTFVKPSTWKNWNEHAKAEWEKAMIDADVSYRQLTTNSLGNLPAEYARGIFPLDIATELCVSASMREWRSVLKLRCDKAAHPDMQNLMKPLLKECCYRLPCCFDDLKELI
jgi:thymidylate synthase (FAD)